MQDSVILQDSKQACWLRFSHPIAVIQTDVVADIKPKLRLIDEAVQQQGLHAAGFIAYEAAPAFDAAFRVRQPASLPLLWFGLYQQAEIVDPLRIDTTRPYSIGPWTPSIKPQDYERAIKQIKAHIARGDTYQVNYTLRLRAPFAGDPWHFFLNLVRAQRGHYSAYIDMGQHVICSVSPELFFQRDGAHLISKPMKGTTTRGKTLAEDKDEITWLRNSAKNRAENVMIVDMIRNDLGMIANLGTVQVPALFAIERYPTVLQMTSTVTAQSDASMPEIMTALFPCASITGAPKVRTMEIIAALETEPRGIYTGCIGFMSPNRHAQFNVAIRTVCVDRDRDTAEYGVGSGVVWDSKGRDEYQECQIKAGVLMQNQPQFELLETMLWEPKKGYFLLDTHVQRLLDSAEYFGFDVSRSAVCDYLQRLTANLDQPHRIRLLVDVDGTISSQTIPLDRAPVQQPWRVALATEPIQSDSPFLYHKTTHRQLYETARASRLGYDDVLLWNERGELTEASIANVVVQFGVDLVTPPVHCGLLAGTYRAALLAQNTIQERVITVDDLKRCDRLFLINSVRKWVEARLA